MAKKLTIITLAFLFWLMPATLLAASQSVVLSLEIIEPDSNLLFNQEMLNKITQMIEHGELTGTLVNPVVIDQVTVEDVSITTTVSGDAKTAVIISIF